jgi:oxygen-independent coproporphyrinogen-3 oxidase
MEGSVTSLRDRDKLRALKAAGVRRLSFGVQTLNERVRRKLRLAATVQDVHDTVDAIEAVGFDDYSHDLMFNLPDQTMADVERDLHVVDEQIRPTYLDCYNLNVMPNTMFSEALQKTTYTERPPEDGQEIAMMRAIVQQTADMGYRQVMSNVFSKRRDRCVLTLEMQLDGTESIGIGPSARGYVGGRGYRNVPDIDDYIERVDRHAFSALAGNVATADEQDERQLVMMGNFGFVKKDAVRTLERYRPQVDFLVREDYAREDAEYLRLTPEGRLWPGNVSQLFFSARQRERRSRAMLNALRYKENPYNQDRQGVSAKLYRKPVVSAASAATESRS